MARARSSHCAPYPPHASLKGARASQQFLAIAKYADGTERDVTAEVEWRLSKPALARFISPARVAPWRTANSRSPRFFPANEAKSTLRIEDAAVAPPVSFRREISAILTARGCNNAICHGGVKGQGGLEAFRQRPVPAGRLRLDHQRRRLPGTHRRSKGRAHPAHQPGRPREEPAAAKAHRGHTARRRQALRNGLRGLQDDPGVDSQRRSLSAPAMPRKKRS